MASLRKGLCWLLGAAMVSSVLTAGTISTAAYDDYPEPGGYCDHGTYTPWAGVQTKHLMFAMPGAWMNDTWENTPGGGAAGCYWWTGYDSPDNIFGHGWPGYQAQKVTETGVDNLWAMDVPVYGNGEKGDATQIIWNNNIDCGTERNPYLNPFYDAAQQTIDTYAQYHSRYDSPMVYDKLFRYIYLENFKKFGVPGSGSLSLNDNSFWEKLNKLAASYLGYDWDNLSASDRIYQVDIILDDNYDELDFSMFGSYAGNFFNEDMVGDYGCYPNEESNGECIAFTFDNMVYVVDLAPENMTLSPLSGKTCFDGDWFFYYGGGEYGSWPTKELNTQMGGVSGNIMSDDYRSSTVPDPTTATSVTDYIPPSPQGYSQQGYPVGGSGKFYFNAYSTGWNNYNTITCFLYDPTSGEQLITWGSKKGNMTYEGNGIWSFDMDAKGYYFTSGRTYSVIFTADWGMQTCDLIIDGSNFGDTAFCTGQRVENSVDSNKISQIVKWQSGRNGNPVTITSLGNVIGDCFWYGETPYSLLLDFLTSTGSHSIYNAVKYNGKTLQQTAFDIGYALGLSQSEIVAACRVAGISLDSGYPSGPESGDGGFSFTKLNDGTYMLTDYQGTREYVEIPATYGYDETPVTAIGDWVFYNNKYLESVSIPDSIKRIGKGAFYGCVRLTEANIPNSVTELGANAFEKCLYLESVTLSDNLTTIKDETFLDCRRLQHINIPDGVKTIGAEAFYNCRGLTTLVLPETVQSVGKAGDPVGVFEDCRCLQTIVLPKNVKSIEENAFEGCRLLTVSAVDGSYAAKYAAANGIATERMGGVTKACKLIGDINSNTLVSIEDATYIQKHLAEFAANHLDSSDPAVLAVADTDGNGSITVNDVTAIQRFLAEMIQAFR